MNETWLLLDCSYLCWRAFHSTGHLQYGADPTGVIYGFLKALKALQARFQTMRTVFAWDTPSPSKRAELYPAYKANRLKESWTEKQREERNGVRWQMNELYAGIVPGLGYRNNLSEDGYEADDLIASVVKHSLPIGDNAVIVSADHDFYQLISDNVTVWHPGREGAGVLMTTALLKSSLKVEPEKWPMVKALAGCSSDNIPGVEGIGELTAIKYLNGQLMQASKAYQKAWHADEIISRNLLLVTLPFPGCPTFELEEDRLHPSFWREVCQEYGLDSLVNS